MNLLEERYRRVLRLLPADYRAEWEEEMVAAFLEGVAAAAAADDGNDGNDGNDKDNDRTDDAARPAWSEIASVATLAMRLRLGGVGAPPRSFAWGEAVRRAAWLGLALHAVLSCVSLGGLLRLYGALGLDPVPGTDYDKIIGPPGSVERLGHLADGAADMAWIAAYLTLVHGRRRAAKVLAVLAVLPAVYRLVDDVVTMVWTPYRSTEVGLVLGTHLSYLLLAMVPVLALLAGFHQDAPAMRRPPRLVVLVAAGAPVAMSLGVLMTEPGLGPRLWPWIDPGGLFYLSLLAICLTYAGVHVLAPARRTPSWPLALVLLMVPAVTTRMAAVYPYYSSSGPADRAGTVVLLIQIISGLLMALLLLALGTQMLRRSPSSPPVC